MINIPMNSSGPLTRDTVMTINQKKVQKPSSSRDVLSLNRSGANASTPQVAPTPAPSHAAAPRPQVAPTPAPSRAATPRPQQAPAPARATAPTPQATPAPARAATPTPQPAPTPPPADRPIPNLLHPMQKGQKAPLPISNPRGRLKASLGWNVKNAACDIDVSAFMLNTSGKVIGDDWFVFYGQPSSPDQSTTFYDKEPADRESIVVDLSKLNPNVSKIVFVLTINEALEKRLNFSMVKDAYIRILDISGNPQGQELVSFKMTDYYSNVTSMMIGELYLHNGNWKFNAIGNGVARDLAGLCELYGVQVE